MQHLHGGAGDRDGGKGASIWAVWQRFRDLFHVLPVQVESVVSNFVRIQDTKDIVGAMSGVFTEGACDSTLCFRYGCCECVCASVCECVMC